MARPASRELAGFYPMPREQTRRIGLMLRSAPSLPGQYSRPSLLDPCAADGEAITDLAASLGGLHAVDLFSCELEGVRFEELRRRLAKDGAAQRRAMHGDAFALHLGGRGADLLFLNPPYDVDDEHGRLEERFLARFTRALCPRGVLAFVAPYYALAASAGTLAREYTNLTCYRFSGADFASFRQVVVFGVRAQVPYREPAADTVALIERWATRPEELPELPAIARDHDRYLVPASTETGFKEWRMQRADLGALVTKARPWWQTLRDGAVVPVANVVPAVPIHDLLLRTYEVAMPPRPSHIAAGIAAGIFNGARIAPDDPASGLPELLVKGVFDRLWRTVEERTDNNGDVTSVVQVQQPKLVVTVLDLRSHRYVNINPGVEATGSLDLGEMTVADLLSHYRGALTRVMERQCRIQYDPRTDAGRVQLPPWPRRKFKAQMDAVRAMVLLLGGEVARRKERRGRSLMLLGEIGSGKSTCALMTARAIGARRPLVLCPPHLLTSWKNEVAAALPGVECRVIESIGDIEELATNPSPETIVAVISRETAKLGHAWQAVATTCPRCGTPKPEGDLARRRVRCPAKRISLRDPVARQAVALAYLLRPYAPDSARLRDLLTGRLDLLRFKALSERKHKPAWPGLDRGLLDAALDVLLEAHAAADSEGVNSAILWLLVAGGDLARVVRVIERAAPVRPNVVWRSLARDLLLLLPPGSQQQCELVALVRSHAGPLAYGHNPWEGWQKVIDHIAAGQELEIIGERIRRTPGGLEVNGRIKAGSLEAALQALEALAGLVSTEQALACGEPLFGAVPQPRRVPLASYIARRHPFLFDLLVVDEAHEYSTDGSAQERAAHRLTSLGLPTIFQTGSVMNGYAESLFPNMWVLSPEFREEFGHDDLSSFVERYGYRKRMVRDKDKNGKVIAFGSVTDRVEREEKTIGDAPGILPSFLFRHLLQRAVTIHKADLAIDLPPCTQEPPQHLQPAPEQLAEYQRMLRALLDAIRGDAFSPLAGKLFGALADFPSFLDRCTADAGNQEGGGYVIRYPESVGGMEVARAKPLPAGMVLPKEAWMLDRIEAELAEGRNVLVFGWHLELLPRLARLIQQRIKEPASILYASKVPTAKRQDWIDREIVRPGRRVLLANPVTIQTGLNNLVHFSTEIFYENPACNPIVKRQAEGRVDRIGQTRPTRILFPLYAPSLQIALYKLLMDKVAISTATDGLDPEGALRAAGVADDEYLAGLSIGKQLWAMLSGEGGRRAS